MPPTPRSPSPTCSPPSSPKRQKVELSPAEAAAALAVEDDLECRAAALGICEATRTWDETALPPTPSSPSPTFSPPSSPKRAAQRSAELLAAQAARSALLAARAAAAALAARSSSSAENEEEDDAAPITTTDGSDDQAPVATSRFKQPRSVPTSRSDSMTFAQDSLSSPESTANPQCGSSAGSTGFPHPAVPQQTQQMFSNAANARRRPREGSSASAAESGEADKKYAR